jgi:hypothetical protein
LKKTAAGGGQDTVVAWESAAAVVGIDGSGFVLDETVALSLILSSRRWGWAGRPKGQMGLSQ